MIQSINRAMQIIHLLSDTKKEKWLITEIAEQTELPISTVYRLIQSLMQHNLVMQIPDTKQYKLGYIWMEIGLKMFESLDIRVVARPIMEQLAADVEETVYLNLPNGNESIIIDRIDSPRNVKIIDIIGERIPMHIGGANKTILANMPSHKVNQILEQLLPDEQARDVFTKDLINIKRQGYAVSYGEKTKGTIAVGAPIFGFDDSVLGAISIEVLAYDLTEERMTFFIEEVHDAAHMISMRLGKA